MVFIMFLHMWANEHFLEICSQSLQAIRIQSNAHGRQQKAFGLASKLIKVSSAQIKLQCYFKENQSCCNAYRHSWIHDVASNQEQMQLWNHVIILMI